MRLAFLPPALTLCIADCITFDQVLGQNQVVELEPVRTGPSFGSEPTCEGPSCGAEADCLDGLDDNGDGRADCADPTCLDRVACVPVAEGAAGYLVDEDESCEGAYEDAALLHGDPANASSRCTGCSCRSDASCSIELRFWKTDADLDCGGDAGDEQSSGPSASLTLRRNAPLPACAGSYTVGDYSDIDENGGLRPVTLQYVSSQVTQEPCQIEGEAKPPPRVWQKNEGLLCREPGLTVLQQRQRLHGEDRASALRTHRQRSRVPGWLSGQNTMVRRVRR